MHRPRISRAANDTFATVLQMLCTLHGLRCRGQHVVSCNAQPGVLISWARPVLATCPRHLSGSPRCAPCGPSPALPAARSAPSVSATHSAPALHGSNESTTSAFLHQLLPRSDQEEAAQSCSLRYWYSIRANSHIATLGAYANLTSITYVRHDCGATES